MEKKDFVKDMQERIENIDAAEANILMDIVGCNVLERIWHNETRFIERLRLLGVPEADFVPACAVMSKLIVDTYIRENESGIVADIGAALVSGHVMSDSIGAEFDVHTNLLIQSAIQLHTKKCMELATKNQDTLFDYIKNTWLVAQQKLHELKGGTAN